MLSALMGIFLLPTDLLLLGRSFDPRMGTTGRVLWMAVPELLHVGAVIVTAAVMVGIMGNTLFGSRAQAMSTLSCNSSVLTFAN